MRGGPSCAQVAAVLEEQTLDAACARRDRSDEWHELLPHPLWSQQEQLLHPLGRCVRQHGVSKILDRYQLGQRTRQWTWRRCRVGIRLSKRGRCWV